VDVIERDGTVSITLRGSEGPFSERFLNRIKGRSKGWFEMLQFLSSEKSGVLTSNDFP
jgi:hypothetical protein